jgi:hypothetical protein
VLLAVREEEELHLENLQERSIAEIDPGAVFAVPRFFAVEDNRVVRPGWFFISPDTSPWTGNSRGGPPDFNPGFSRWRIS